MMQMAIKENVKEWAHGIVSVVGVLKLATFWAFNGCELYVQHLQCTAHLSPVGFPFSWSNDIAPLHSLVDVTWLAWAATKPAPFDFKSRTYLRASGRDTALHNIFRDTDQEIMDAIVTLPIAPKYHSVVEALEDEHAEFIRPHLRGGGDFTGKEFQINPNFTPIGCKARATKASNDTEFWMKRHCTKDLERKAIKLEMEEQIW